MAKKIGWYNRNKTGNTVKQESHRHSLASRGIKTSAPKGSRVLSSGGSPTPNFDMVKKGKMTYDDFSKKNFAIRYLAVRKITDQKLLEKIALNDSNNNVRRQATYKLTNQKVLEKIFKNDSSILNRSLVLERITNQKFLENIFLKDKDWSIRAEAIKHIKNPNQKVLKKVVLNPYEHHIVVSESIKKIKSIDILKQVLKIREDPLIGYIINRRLKQLYTASY